MVAAITRLSWYGNSAAEPAGINAEDNAGIVFNREDTRVGQTVAAGLPIPVTTSTVYSWPKLVALEVLVAGDTDIANRRFSLSGPLATGLHWYIQALAAYARPTAAPADAVTDAAVPAGYTEVTPNAMVVYDNTILPSSVLGRNGAFVECVLGVDSQYAANGGQAGLFQLPTYRLTYDET